MGWRSDWLYRLIFDEVKHLWDDSRRPSKFGPGPSEIEIKEMTQADWEAGFCTGEVRRKWRYSGDTFDPVPVDTGIREIPERLPGMYFKTGYVRFRISDDRKQVLFMYQLGPRYGGGQIHDVTGQGKKGKLGLGGRLWIS